MRRREKWPQKSWEVGEIERKSREEGEDVKKKFREEGEIGSKSREEGEIGSESREKGDLLPYSSPLFIYASVNLDCYNEFLARHTVSSV